jgi:hypothetical protein
MHLHAPGNASTKEHDFTYRSTADWITVLSAHKPTNCLGILLGTLQGEASGFGRLHFLEKNLSTVGLRVCGISVTTAN